MEDGLQPESSIPETKEAMLLKEAIETSGWAEKIALEQVREINYLIQGTEKEDKKSSVEEGGGGGDSRFLIEEEEEVAAAAEEEEETGILALEDEKEETFVGVEEEEEEENGKLSTEELNKRFDDFIRKMKEEIRIEAQRQLVIVQ